jgi:type I restriction enzyme, S subunit
MTDWLSGVLDDLCEVEYGTRVTRKRDGGSKYPVYGGGGATFNLDDFNREDQMIVSRFAMSEECVRFVPGKFFLNDSGLTVRTRDESKMTQEFLDQQLLARSNEIYATARGTAQKNMDMTMFRNMELAIPDSLAEQKRIVALLDAATARVTEITACYEQARTHANNLFTSALRDSLESNPDWPVKALGGFCEIYQPQTIGMKDMVDGGKYIVYGANGPIGHYDRFNHEKSEVTVTCRGATCGTVNVTPPQVWITGNAMVVRPIETEMTKQMMRYVLEGLDYSSIITGAAQPQITRQTIAPTTIQVPPLVEQKRIVARLDSMKAKTAEMVAAYDAKLTAAKNLRQSILESAFEGKL